LLALARLQLQGAVLHADLGEGCFGSVQESEIIQPAIAPAEWAVSATWVVLRLQM